MLAAATSFFSRTAISQSYNIGLQNGSRSSTPTPSGSSTSGTLSLPASVKVGLWKVQGAAHKVTSKRVSVWTFDKRVEMEGLGPLSKERVLEIMKAEVIAALANIDTGLITSAGCGIRQTAPSVYPRYVCAVFTICFADRILRRDGGASRGNSERA